VEKHINKEANKPVFRLYIAFPKRYRNGTVKLPKITENILRVLKLPPKSKVTAAPIYEIKGIAPLNISAIGSAVGSQLFARIVNARS